MWGVPTKDKGSRGSELVEEETDSVCDRLSIREGHLQRALSERLKVFEEFVSMFEATDTSYL